MTSPIDQNTSNGTKESCGLRESVANHSPLATDPKQLPDPDKPSAPAPPPNGGLAAWLQVAAGFAIFFNTWGMVSSFAVFQTYYESGKLFHASSSDISWIGAVQTFLLQLTGVVAGPLYDRGYVRQLVIIGSFMVVFGLMMLSLCTKYWEALLAQGFCLGIGSGLLFTPIVSLIPTWFSTRIGLAVGIASSGSSFGGIIYPIVLYRLISEIGFPWAVRCIGFIALVTFLVPLTVIRMRVRVPKPRAMVDWAGFRDAPFMLFTLGLILCFVGNSILLCCKFIPHYGGICGVEHPTCFEAQKYPPLQYISFYPADRHFTDTSLAFYIAAIFNAGSIFGRILPNAVSDHIGAFNTIGPLQLILGVTIICLLAVHNAAGMIVEALATGFFSGVVVSMPPVCFRILTENKAMIGTRVGMGFAIGGLGLLAGAPGGGAILGTIDPLDWTGLWLYGGVSACVAGLIYLSVRVMRSGFALNVKA